MHLYLDASALMKLIARERHSDAIGELVNGRQVATSELALAEIPRSSRRRATELRPAAARSLLESAGAVLALVTLLPLDRTTLEAAGRLDDLRLRSLDAIHVATALIAGDDLQAFVTYDRRQGGAAQRAGFEVLSPGV